MTNAHDDGIGSIPAPRILQSINQPTIDGNLLTTMITLRFKQPRNGTAINIPQKHQQLLSELQSIDNTVSFIDNSLTPSIQFLKICLLVKNIAMFLT